MDGAPFHKLSSQCLPIELYACRLLFSLLPHSFILSHIFSCSLFSLSFLSLSFSPFSALFHDVCPLNCQHALSSSLFFFIFLSFLYYSLFFVLIILFTLPPISFSPSFSSPFASFLLSVFSLFLFALCLLSFPHF